MSLCQAPLIARVTGDALSTGIWGVVPRGPSLRAMDGLIWSLQVPRDKIGLDQRRTPGAPFPPHPAPNLAFLSCKETQP